MCLLQALLRTLSWILRPCCQSCRGPTEWRGRTSAGALCKSQNVILNSAVGVESLWGATASDLSSSGSDQTVSSLRYDLMRYCWMWSFKDRPAFSAIMKLLDSSLHLAATEVICAPELDVAEYNRQAGLVPWAPRGAALAAERNKKTIWKASLPFIHKHQLKLNHTQTVKVGWSGSEDARCEIEEEQRSGRSL